jgi:hypothetical protein
MKPKAKYYRNTIAVVGIALMGLGIPGLARAGANFNFTTIDVPGSTRTAANGNSTHEIAGEFDDKAGNTHGFVLSKGVFTQIDVPGASSTRVNGISANGRLAGTYQDKNGVLQAYFSSAGSFTTLDPFTPRSDRKVASSMRKAKWWGPTGIPLKNVMASSGATASSPLC